MLNTHVAPEFVYRMSRKYQKSNTSNSITWNILPVNYQPYGPAWRSRFNSLKSWIVSADSVRTRILALRRACIHVLARTWTDVWRMISVWEVLLLASTTWLPLALYHWSWCGHQQDHFVGRSQTSHLNMLVRNGSKPSQKPHGEYF